MLGGGSPWLRKVLEISSYFRIRSIYTFATWCDLKGKWEDRKWQRSPNSDTQLYKLHKKGLDCTTAKGCVSEPSLHLEERFKFVVIRILHLVIGVGDYLTTFIRKKCKDLPTAPRDCVQDRLKTAKPKISLKGHASPDGEETWLLLANWRHIGKPMKLPNHVIDVVVEMASLLKALQSWEFDSSALNCGSMAKKFRRTIRPTIGSPYLLWLQFDAPEVLKNSHPWGCGMFSGDQPSQLTATDVPTAMFVCDKRGPGVIVSGVWPPIPIDECQLTMDPRKVGEFRKKWKIDVKAAVRELDGSMGSPDQGRKSQPWVRSEKAALASIGFGNDATTGRVGEGRASSPFPNGVSIGFGNEAGGKV